MADFYSAVWPGLSLAITDGNSLTFVSQGSSLYLPPSYVFEKLVANGDGTFTLTDIRSREQWIFNSNGTLHQIVDPNSYTTTLAYDGIGRLSTATDDAGHVITFHYDNSSFPNQITSITDPSLGSGIRER